MTISPEILEQALETFTIKDPSQEIIKQNSAIIQAVQNEPEGILLFLEVIHNTQNQKIRKSAIGNLFHLVKEHWNDIPPPIQAQAQQSILAIIQGELEYDEMNTMSAIVAHIFVAVHGWNDILKLICAAYASQNHQFTMVYLKEIFPILPSNLVKELKNTFYNMAFLAIQSEDSRTIINSIKIFIIFYMRLKDITILGPVFQVLPELLSKSEEFDSQTFGEVWQFVRNILSIHETDPSMIPLFFENAMKYLQNESFPIEKRRLILSEFEPVVSIIPFELLQGMLTLSFSLAYAFISTENQLPDDYMEIIDSSLMHRKEEVTEFIKGKVVEYLQNSSSLPDLILGLFVLKSLLQYDEDEMYNETTTIVSSVQAALETQVPPLQITALKVIDVLNEFFNVLSGTSIHLMKLVMPLLISPDEDIRPFAANAFLTLCDLCDTEIDGLFEQLWQFHEQNLVPPDSIKDYIAVIAKVLDMSKTIPDTVQASVITFSDTILFSGQFDYQEQSVGLNLMSALFKKSPSLLPTLIPKLVPLLNSLFECNDDELALHQALIFLANLASSFGPSVLEFEAHYFETIANIISERSTLRYYLTAMEAAAKIIKFCNDNTLVEPMTREILFLLQDESDDVTTVREVCTYISMMAKSFATVDIKIVKTIFSSLIYAATENDDHELISRCFEALSKMYKRLRSLDVPYFDEHTNQLIQNIFTGQIKILNGSADNLFTLPSDLASYFLEFVEVYLRNSPSNSNDIFAILLKWIEKADEPTIVLLIGLVTENAKRTDINPNILVEIIKYLSTAADKFTFVQLYHNISYFLNTFLLKFNDQVPLAMHFVPFLNKWWSEGREKQVGYQDCLGNIAVLYLRLFTMGGEIPIETVNDSISLFPPTDKTEIEPMALLILQIFASPPQVPQLYLTTCTTLAKFLTEPPTSQSMKKISQESLGNLRLLFTSIVDANEQLKNEILALFVNNREKQEIISQYF